MAELAHLTPPNDHLTRKLLARSVVGRDDPLAYLVESLCTESLYVIKDDFDRGLNPNLWTARNMELAEHEFGGVLYSASPEDDPPLRGGGAVLRSRLAGWVPNRRAAVQLRANLSRAGSHFELGFVKEDTGDNAVVTIETSTTITRGSESFGVATRSPKVSGWYVVSAGTNGTAQTAVATRVAETGWTTFLVAINEQGETRLWINGQHDNTFARRTDMHVTQGHYLWFQALKGAVAIDYLQCWQERSPI